jgi:hypothetical protein
MFSECLIDDATRCEAVVDGSRGWLGVGWSAVDGCRGKKAGKEMGGGFEI